MFKSTAEEVAPIIHTPSRGGGLTRRLAPMKVARQNKLEAQLAATESELLSFLRATLPHTATHGNTLFFSSQFCPDYVRPHTGSARATRCSFPWPLTLRIREELGLSVTGSPGQLYISACQEAANTANGNRRGPRQLASWLLAELGPN